MKVYQRLASLVQARANCANGNNEWFERHTDAAEDLVKEYMPSGSGFDAGTKIDFDKTTPERLTFTTSFHHMNENGYYDGWTKHNVVVTPSLAFGFNLRVTGRDRNDIKDYIAETFQDALSDELKA